MFTGLVEEVGTVLRLVRHGEGAHLHIAASRVLDGTRIGDSINTNGACLTVVELSPGAFAVDCMPETLAHTTIGGLPPGAPVNLERALALGDRLGGHLVLGHVDAVGTIRAVTRRGIAWELSIALPPQLRGLVAAKGSIAIDGISLTVTSVGAEEFGVGIIPHTMKETTLRAASTGARVNLEADVLARYVHGALAALGGSAVSGDETVWPDHGDGVNRSGLSETLLREHGFFD